MLVATRRIMDISEMKPLLPLDFSLSMKSEMSLTSLGGAADPIMSKRDGGITSHNNNNNGSSTNNNNHNQIHTNCNGGTGGGMLLSPEKGSSSAFKVVTPKHCDGRSKEYMIYNLFFLECDLFEKKTCLGTCCKLQMC